MFSFISIKIITEKIDNMYSVAYNKSKESKENQVSDLKG